MRFLRFDSTGGASGDMILAVLVDLGVDPAAISEPLRSLGLGPFSIEAQQVQEAGLRGTRVVVDIPEQGHERPRGLKTILTMIEQSTLPDGVKVASSRVFERLAQAEARVHDMPPEKVHFHEVGALDAIIDIVGACTALAWLRVDRVDVSPLPLGHGTVECHHGTIPVPAPATVELLRGFPVVNTDEPYELVTPTGAALLATWRSGGREPPAAVLSRVGYGFGHRTLHSRPNLLRGFLQEAPDAGVECADDCLVLECNLDDTVPELLGSLSVKLVEAGALEVFSTAVQMKKQRPGTLLTVLCAPPDRERFLDLVFAESTTFGVREYPVRRSVLARRRIEVETPYGRVGVKIGSWKGTQITRAPEHRDCAACAGRCGVSVRAVYEAALLAAGRGHNHGAG